MLSRFFLGSKGRKRGIHLMHCFIGFAFFVEIIPYILTRDSHFLSLAPIEIRCIFIYD